MAYDPLNDPEFDAIKGRIDNAGDEDEAEQLAADIGARRDAAEHPYRRFVMNLPKNLGVGTWKALVNTVDTASEVGAATNPAAIATKAVGGDEARQKLYPTLSEQYPEFMDSLRGFTSQWERNDTLSDDITQGVAQFAVPFMGWLKAAGGLSTASKAVLAGKSLAAEAVTAASAFEPHEGRVADLLEMGRESETKLGTLLRKLTPDESLANKYIDYMTDREGESASEGRWKNAVDAVVSSAGVAGLLKGAAITHKTTKALVNGALEDLGGARAFGPGKQQGMVAFHGTPHDFDAFELSKIGTGEGNQVYGHGLYFAESEGTAKHYRGALSRKAFAPGSPMENAYSQMEQSNWDAKQAYTTLMQKATRSQDPEFRQTLISAADKIKAGNVKQLGKLMTVDIPDETVTKMMDWDQPFKEQQPSVQRVMKKMLEDGGMLGQVEDILDGITGEQFYKMISDKPELTSKMMNDAGIPGIRYLDQQSRGKTKGTSNLVLFDDKLVTITKKE